MPRILLPSIKAMLGEYIIDDNLTDSITIKRGGVTQAAQSVRVRKVSQLGFSEGEPVSTPGATLEIIGATTLDIQADDTFTWDGALWVVMEAPVVGTDHVSRRAIAEMRV